MQSLTPPQRGAAIPRVNMLAALILKLRARGEISDAKAQALRALTAGDAGGAESTLAHPTATVYSSTG